ncbi:TIGR03084 family metal-binding protein [uncultured Sneathiella sp.]|uniref:TIGR03084 family metal-binding protein n=1 Tax=uncultured Sneathiella sp. TaxID=879315 RepID=UPI0030ECEB19|tara:strand:+ start:47215 stop:48006 length:792 start_codon:yes stop_codon:yes gene_type:complete
MSELLQEYRALDRFVSKLGPDGFNKLTPGTTRSVYDQLSHIAYFDKVSLLAIENPAAFADLAEEFAPKFTEKPLAETVREYLAIHDPEELIDVWRGWYERLSAHLDDLPDKGRLPWFGPDMSVKSFATARLAQTWAHGQDIYDALGHQRDHTDRIKNIAHLGVITFDWSFTNRNMTPPETKVRVELVSPSGANWLWNDHPDLPSIVGRAEEFCLVATQRRNIRDTDLEITGADAMLWMENCQCFAGPPLTGPEQGVRLQNYAG